MSGDYVAHKEAPEHKDADWATAWPIVQENIKVSIDLLKKHFPNTLVLPSIGNNDGYHNQAVDENQKASYYGFLHDLWFTDYPGNAKLVDSVT